MENSKRAIRIVLLFVACIAVILIVRLYVLQVMRGDEYALLADRQYIRPTYSSFNRGSIFFTGRDGELITAATIKSGFEVVMQPNLIVDMDSAYNALQAFVPLDYDVFKAHARKVDDPHEQLVPRVEEDVGDAIYKADIPGIVVYPTEWRFYPGGELAAQTIGFVQDDTTVRKGKYGLERYYEDTLGRREENLYTNFFVEIFADIDTLFSDTHEDAGDLVLTIEPVVEQTLEKTLLSVQDKWNSTETGGIIINPKTGAIYALASVPTFNPNTYNEVDDVAVFTNPLVERVYEMGSIVKALSMAIALDTGAVTADSTYYDTGTIIVDGARISNYDGEARGEASMQTLLNESLNVGAVHLYQEVGHDVFRTRLLSLGIGEETGIDLPGEVHGLTNNIQSTRDVELANASFGQGIALTPIATARALSALANGGILITPHVVAGVERSLGRVKKFVPTNEERVFSEETSRTITRMLVTVVDEALAGGTRSLPRYSVAAKTGTAQVASPDGKYFENEYLHSFFGYFPAFDPEFLILLYTVKPQEVRYASQTLTDPFTELVDFLIGYYDVPPDRDINTENGV